MTPTTVPGDFQPAPNHLQDLVVLVTGATGDVGRILCPTLARHGATVILAGRNVAKLEKLYDEVAASGPEPAIYPIDLAGATAEHHAELAGTVAGEFQELHGLVHLAADFEGLTPLAQTPADKWMRAIQVNLNAPFLLSQALMPLLLASGRGRLVFTLDDESRTQQAYWGAYGVAQSGQRAMVEIAAEELESSATEVVAVCPPPLKGHHRSQYSMAEDRQLTEPERVVPAYLYALDDGRESLHGRALIPGS